MTWVLKTGDSTRTRVVNTLPDHESIRRHNERVVWTIAAAQDEPSETELILEAQADLQNAIGWLRLEMSRTERESPLYRQLSFIEDQATKALARLHVLLEMRGVTMMMPSQHPDVTGHEK